MQAVIFDWGGTLTPWRDIGRDHGWKSYAGALYPDDVARAAAVVAALVAAEDSHWDRVRTEGRAFTVAQVLASAGIAEHEAGLAALRASLDPVTRTDPAVVPLVTALRERGLRTGVLSSTMWPGVWHDEILRRDGARDCFDACVWTSDLPWTKPNAAAFRAAMDAVGADDPSRCVYVGDRMYDDISGAKAVGMRAVFVPHTRIPPEQDVPVNVTPDAVINELSDLLPIVDGWLA
ncbi:MAG TPA: HAD-IA family hydrolase [Pseudonocardiaceae bacterium]|nr:HAD-IA family hydrolase [Pseudonocardiaceae bacterium]